MSKTKNRIKKIKSYLKKIITHNKTSHKDGKAEVLVEWFNISFSGTIGILAAIFALKALEIRLYTDFIQSLLFHSGIFFSLISSWSLMMLFEQRLYPRLINLFATFSTVIIAYTYVSIAPSVVPIISKVLQEIGTK